MSREQEYKQLANDMFRRASAEESAQLTAQWKILGARYLSRQTGKAGDEETFYDPVQSELLERLRPAIIKSMANAPCPICAFPMFMRIRTSWPRRPRNAYPCAHGSQMSEADALFARALELLQEADNETDPVKRAGLEALAEEYRAKAGEARKEGITIEFEHPPDGPKHRSN